MSINKSLFIKQYGKKAYKEYCKLNRVTSGIKTGTIVMSTSKNYSRKVKHKNSLVLE